MKKIVLVALAFIMAFSVFAAQPEKTAAATGAAAAGESKYYTIANTNTYSKVFHSFASGRFDTKVYNIGNNGRKFQLAFKGEKETTHAAVANGTAEYRIQKLDPAKNAFVTYKTLKSDPGTTKWYVKMGSTFPSGTYRIQMKVQSSAYFWVTQTWYSGRFSVW